MYDREDELNIVLKLGKSYSVVVRSKFFGHISVLGFSNSLNEAREMLLKFSKAERDPKCHMYSIVESKIII